MGATPTKAIASLKASCPRRRFRAWIAVTDSTRANGCLRILPGTHKRGLARHVLSRRFPPDKEIETVDESGALDVEMETGDAVILDPFVFHASWPNASGALRIGLLAGFMRPKAEYLEHERQGSYAYQRGGEPRWEPVRWDAAWPFRI